MSAPRVAFFMTTSGHSGVDRVANNLMHAFVTRGVDVDLLHVADHGPDPDRAPASVRVIELNARHAVSALPALVAYLRRERPDGMLSDKHRVNLVAVVARMLARVPTRLVVRTGTTVSRNLADRSRMGRAMHAAIIRRLYRRADAFVVPSIAAADDVAAFARMNRDRVTAVPNPVVGPDFAAATDVGVSHPWFADTRRVPVILGIGELSARKDFATLIDAVAIVHRICDCRLVILGEGGQRRALEHQIVELGLTDHIDLPGFSDNPYSYLARGDLFVSSSRWEGLSMVLAEALAAGTPAVATDCPSGPREILDDGCLGELTPVGDAEALAGAIARRLDAPRDSDALRAGAERYTFDASASAYLRLLLPPGLRSKQRINGHDAAN